MLPSLSCSSDLMFGGDTLFYLKFGGDALFPFMICLVVMLSCNLKFGGDAPFPFMICLVVMLS